jgi:murein L,D-transpeptidase YafK
VRHHAFEISNGLLRGVTRPRPLGSAPVVRVGDFASGKTIVKALRVLALLVLAIALTRLVGSSMITKIVVSKSQRSLTTYGADGRILRIFPVIVGRASDGAKEREGDERTPEGEYYVCFKNPQSRFHLSLGLSYPGLADAERGLASGMISAAEYREIADAHAARRIPPWKTSLGGEIFIHGEMAEREGTAGCVAVSNEAIEELFPHVQLGTPVFIEP